MMFKFMQSAQYVILTDGSGDICYIAISSSGHTSHELPGLYLYHGCKYGLIDTDEDGHLKIIGIDAI